MTPAAFLADLHHRAHEANNSSAQASGRWAKPPCSTAFGNRSGSACIAASAIVAPNDEPNTKLSSTPR